MREFLIEHPGALLTLAVFGLIIAMQRGQARKQEALRRAGLLPPEGEKPTDHTVRLLIERRELIEAIKVYRALHGTGLKESKEAVEKMRAEMEGKA